MRRPAVPSPEFRALVVYRHRVFITACHVTTVMARNIDREGHTNDKNGSRRNVTGENIRSLTGLSAVLGGTLYVAVQLIHPPETVAAVSSDTWFVVACLSLAMSVFVLLGITGIYVGQLADTGLLGLVGYSLFGLFWLTSVAWSFVEAFVLPQVATAAPEFVAGFLGVFGGAPSDVHLGVLPAIAPLAGVMYLLGGLLFGVATYRAEVLPRLAGALLAVGAVVTLAAAVVPHPQDRILAVPVGVALVWLGYALWSQREESVGS